jgi:hypothetical protein
MVPRTLCDDGGSQPPYGSKRTSARTRQPRQLSFRRAPALLRWPRHHTKDQGPLTEPSYKRVGRAYKRKDQGPLTEGWPHGDEDGTGTHARPLAPSPAWTLVTPYCKRTRPGRGTNTKAAGFPPLSRPSPAASLPPFALGLAPTHLGWGTRRHLTRQPRDPPVSKRRQLARQVGACCVLTNSFLSSSRWAVSSNLSSPGRCSVSGVLSSCPSTAATT